ncbi:CDP-alcohol phosphatidyltransferase family protein [Roseitranquillus sediminis]|uniref:CDP-alcohol phosphatidyltransferase family protein n=1 Tax=Roseitranquillus sediminis TaxID=2809051 RepID=UPI001D0CA212|nr:phosphatidylcholine/phosphatidylserine synthase [Roseitranquillus sediminis]MBM9595800.1 phosphatidylcholine/phosphatidylserine synthase [Roseitranquillus sediminis]
MPRADGERDTLPFLQLLPSIVTLVGLCASLTAIRFVFAERFELAALLIIFAALIDGVDGLLARRLDATSSFGAELDSLSDFVNFGVAPGLLVYQFALTDTRGFGWAFVLIYVICCCLRLARFNVNRDVPPADGRAHFTGVPAPAGAMLGLLPVFLSLAEVVEMRDLPALVAAWVGLVGILMISRLRTFSPKSLRIPRDKAIWVLIGAVAIIGLMFTRFWLLMAVADAIYAAILAASVARLRRRRTKDKEWTSPQ